MEYFDTFTFTKNSDYGDSTSHVQIQFSEDYLPEIVDRFKEFLLGCGFIFDDLVVTYKQPEDAEPQKTKCCGGGCW